MHKRMSAVSMCLSVFRALRGSRSFAAPLSTLIQVASPRVSRHFSTATAAVSAEGEEEGFSELHKAAFEGNVRKIRNLIADGAHPNATTHRLKMTPLHLAVASGHLEAVAELVNTPGINIHAVDADADRLTPVFVAARCGHKEILNFFLVEDPKAAISPNTVNENGLTLAHCVASCRDHNNAISCMQLLLQRGTTVNVLDNMGLTPLHEAVRAQNDKLVALLLQKGADPNLRELIAPGGGATDGYDVAPIGVTALHFAAFHGETKKGIQMVRDLLLAGASPSVPDDLGNTPLHSAVSRLRGAEESVDTLRYREAVTGFIVRELLSHKAAVNARSLSGNTPLHLAAANGWGEAVFALLEYGADVRIVNSDGLTAAEYADKAGEAEIGEILKDVAPSMR